MHKMNVWNALFVIAYTIAYDFPEFQLLKDLLGNYYGHSTCTKTENYNVKYELWSVNCGVLSINFEVWSANCEV